MKDRNERAFRSMFYQFVYFKVLAESGKLKQVFLAFVVVICVNKKRTNKRVGNTCLGKLFQATLFMSCLSSNSST